jgi:hypothetical protein
MKRYYLDSNGFVVPLKDKKERHDDILCLDKDVIELEQSHKDVLQLLKVYKGAHDCVCDSCDQLNKRANFIINRAEGLK